MTQPLASVTRTMTVRVSIPGELPAPLPAQLHYEVHDPYAVRLSLGAPMARPVDWVFARDLLAAGVHRTSGVGDVLVIPLPGTRPRVRVVLRSGTGTAVVALPMDEVADFLRQSCALVPAGMEGLHLDLDHAVAELTGRNV
ncbi:SsgA family sporulation/cell division regulator [Streptomyces sp. NPDC015345]|uniref:SsgA family sporulation/cell division regulator n=1 Tax=Streptomyces sp. NPDC015345 TaxID=3364953 RepID=UPI0036FC9079